MVKGYLEIRRTWNAGDTVDLELPMPVERIYANPNVTADAGRVALKRGPLVYCCEEVDNPQTPVPLMRLPRGAKVADQERADLFDGVVTLVVEGERAATSDWGNTLYRTTPAADVPGTFTAIPYYLWNNRKPGRMQVWIPEA